MLAHAEGGGVLYVDAAADPEMTLRLIEASVDRLGVCNRLNLLLVHRDARGGLEPALELLGRLGLSTYGTERAREYAAGLLPLDVPIGHEWANDASRVASVTVDVVGDLAEAVEIANTQVSGLAADGRDGERAERRGLSRLATAARRRSGTRRRASRTALR